MAIRGVVGIYVGLAEDGETECIRVMLRDDNAGTKRALPRQLEGYRVIAEVTGEIRPLPGGSPRRGSSAIETASAITETPLSRTSKLTPSPTRTRTKSQPTRTAAADQPPPLSVTPGKPTIVEVQLSPTRQTQARMRGNPPITTVQLALSVPRGFDPRKLWRVVVVSGAKRESHLERFKKDHEQIVQAGSIAFAVESPQLPANETEAWHRATLGAALDYLAQQWPASTKWPLACGQSARCPTIRAALRREGRIVD
ncbi:hypothetical protein BH20VER1_BH20VER1_28570 [soil metagenome]